MSSQRSKVSPNSNFRVIIVKESYFSDGKTSEQRKVNYLKDNIGEKANYVHYKDKRLVKKSDNIAKVRALIGIPSKTLKVSKVYK